MLREIFLFELHYRRERIVTYLYFFIIFLTGFLAVTSPVVRISGMEGEAKANAPFIVSSAMLSISLLFTMITSAIMGVAIVRDFDFNIEAILYTTSIKKEQYLAGRFLGAFFILILINCAIWLGIMSGFLAGPFLPWSVAWRSEDLLPFHLWNYVQPFLILVVPNLFFTGSFFFMSGALGRNTIVIYSQGFLLLLIYLIANGMLRDIDNPEFAALLDPFGIQTFKYITRYWTLAEQNTKLVSFDGILLYNRLIWLAISFLVMFITYAGFSFNVIRKPLLSIKTKRSESPVPPYTPVRPVVYQSHGRLTYLQQIAHQTFFYFRLIFKEIPFITIVVSGLLLLFFNGSKMTTAYGTDSYPTTQRVLELLNNSFGQFIFVIATFYSGELVWRERTQKIDQIFDALPITEFQALLSKVAALTLIYTVLVLILVASGILIQVSYGYYQFNLDVYIGSLFGATFSIYVIYTLLAVFVQVMVNDKFFGFTISFGFVVVVAVLDSLGFEHDLWHFPGSELGIFSSMNGFGHFIVPFFWFRLYWSSFAIALLLVTILFAVRGSAEGTKKRWALAKQRLTPAIRKSILAAILIFVSSGFYIYYNTSILNRFENTSAFHRRQAEYEKKFKKYEFVTQPKVTAVTFQVELYPSRRGFTADGFYFLKNKSDKPIRDIHVQYPFRDPPKVSEISFNRYSTLRESDNENGYYIYELQEMLQAGDSLKMNFNISYESRGFEEGNSRTQIVYNGTFFNNSYFPDIGYNGKIELDSEGDRKKFGLKDKALTPSQPDSICKLVNVVSDDADYIYLEGTIGTEPDQIAVTSGNLEKEWSDKGRRYFHYKSKVPIPNFYSIVSARYATKRIECDSVELEIYYHPGHESNLDGMMKGMEVALGYCSKNFGPYPHGNLRIVEVPQYSASPKAFATTIPFSEGVEFVFRSGKSGKELDVAYYYTIKEVARQWWGQQLIAAKMNGSAMLSESLAKYSALVVLKNNVPAETMQRYLKYELDLYLRGRAEERMKEYPLESVLLSQAYIHSHKASLVFYGLQDYIGEDKLNEALYRFYHAWGRGRQSYPASSDLINEIRKVVPDSLSYLIHDFFETVTTFENKTTKAIYEEKHSGQFEVTINVSSEKMRAGEDGNESAIAIDDWIDIGIYAKNDDGVEKLVYLKKHKITRKDNLFTISVNTKPTRAGIDPLHKLIDRHSDDNTRVVEPIVVIDF